MKATKTKYNGTEYRSKLEARWAAFFHANGQQFGYETVELWLPEIRTGYCPDFELTGVIGTAFAEVKPVWPTSLELRKMRLFSEATKVEVILLVGQPEYRGYWTIHPEKKDRIVMLEYGVVEITDENLSALAVYESGLPPDFFSLAYRKAVERSRRLRFDGYDADRLAIESRYSISRQSMNHKHTIPCKPLEYARS